MLILKQWVLQNKNELVCKMVKCGSGKVKSEINFPKEFGATSEEEAAWVRSEEGSQHTCAV